MGASLNALLGQGSVEFLSNSRTFQILIPLATVFPHSLLFQLFQVILLFPSSPPPSALSSPGKDARLFVFRLSAVQKGIEGKQAVKSKCECRENKLEKTKGGSILRILVVSVQLIFFSDCPDFT